MEKKFPTIAENIRRFRKVRGWTQKQLGEMSGLQPKHISQLENGDSQAGKKVIERLCKAFAVDEMTMRFGERKEPEQEKPHDPDAELVELLLRKVRSRWNTSGPVGRTKIEEALVRIQGEANSE